VFDPVHHHRRSIRLKGYDYSQAGSYFITICTQNRVHRFGEIVDGEMKLNEAGLMVNVFCKNTERHFENIKFDLYTTMPNHFHAIITVGAGSPRPMNNNGAMNNNGQGNPAHTPPPTIGNIMGYFKYQTTKHINLINKSPGRKLWQRNYWEHIIRNENEYQRIFQYILNNPRKWEQDKLNGGAGNIVMESETEYGNESWMI